MRSNTPSWQHSFAWSSLRAWVVTAALVVIGAAYGMVSSRYDESWLAVVAVSAVGVAAGISVFRWIQHRVALPSTFVLSMEGSYSSLTSPELIRALTNRQEPQQSPPPVGWKALFIVRQTPQVAQTQSSDIGLAALAQTQQRQTSITGLALAS